MVTPAQKTESAVLWFLSQDLGRASYLRKLHVADKYGACAGCCSQTQHIAYPCVIRQLAEECIHRQIPLPRRAS
jgi:hypothetical protein